MIDIVPLGPQHQPAIESLLDERFGPARHNRTAYRLRERAELLGGFSFVAMDGDQLVGSLQCWPIRLKSVGGSRLPLVLLGPVAVAASREGQGIGSALMRASLAAIDAADSPPVLLIGDAPYYGRFGFSAVATRHWELPGPVDHARLLLRGPTTGLPRIAWVEAASVNPSRPAKVA
ncbi:GNAT family N-acetyltransferase [Sandarakinorhabdus oryzae]|uniref:GNAT family N-acetyltransferase n=1 Tax=Sandarakinorhabdus oryzae TaxID=2675220 RepID=UPI0012E1F65F|nr:N-acetyltransferase [Sandarakinorhabdus oryzae]